MHNRSTGGGRRPPSNRIRRSAPARPCASRHGASAPGDTHRSCPGTWVRRALPSAGPPPAGPPDRARPEGPASSRPLGLGELNPLPRLWPVRPIAPLAVQEVPIVRLARLELPEGHGITPRTAAVLLHLLPGQLPVFPPAHLVEPRVDCLLLPLPSLRCWWVLGGCGRLGPGGGSFAPGTLHPSSTDSPLPSASHRPQSARPSPSGGPLAPDGAAAPGHEPRPFVLTSFLRSTPRADSWPRFGRNCAAASSRADLLGASGRGVCSLLPALSSAGGTRCRPYRPLGRDQVFLGHTRLFPPVSPAHTGVRRGGSHAPSPPSCRLDHSPSLADRFIVGTTPVDDDPVVLRRPFRPHRAVSALALPLSFGSTNTWTGDFHPQA
jgi:hypothetical protein